MPTYARADLAFERGEGAWLIGTDGKHYLDFAGGVAVSALGHAHPKLVAAISEQAKKVWHVSNLFRIPEAEPLAGRLPQIRFPYTRIFRKFRCRGDGSRDQTRAQISRCIGQTGKIPHHRIRGLLPRPHARDARRRRQPEVSRRLRAAARRFRSRSLRRSRRGEESHHS